MIKLGEDKYAEDINSLVSRKIIIFGGKRKKGTFAKSSLFTFSPHLKNRGERDGGGLSLARGQHWPNM